MRRKSFFRVCGFAFVLGVLAVPAARTQQRPADPPPDPVKQRLDGIAQSLSFGEESLAKRVDEQMMFHRLEDIAEVDKVRYTGPPPRVIKNPTGQGAGNPVILTAYTFLPRKRGDAKLPLIVFVHGGVHSNFNTSNVHILRELIQQGYAVLAPEYRGSSGFGREFWELIDYGGLEVEDVFAAKQWMLENHDNIDPQRVGIIGWSHGGLITLMSLFAHPKDFQVGYAGVPVCDLVARM